MTMVLHGIKNCDTVKKARRWLEANNVDYRFHDLRADGLDEEMLRKWLGQVAWERLLNTRGTTWRKLPDNQRRGLDESEALALMLAHPTLIKRPVLTIKDKCHIGFKADDYAALFR